MPEGTEREAKERQGQNSQANMFPNFSMKIKVAPFVFTSGISINLLLT